MCAVGIIHKQRHTVGMAHLRNCLYVRNISQIVGRGYINAGSLLNVDEDALNSLSGCFSCNDRAVLKFGIDPFNVKSKQDTGIDECLV